MVVRLIPDLILGIGMLAISAYMLWLGKWIAREAPRPSAELTEAMAALKRLRQNDGKS